MKIPDIPTISLLMFLVTGSSMLYAQDPTETEKPETLEINFSVFPLEPGKWSGIYFAPSGDPTEKVEEVEFNLLERSIYYKYKGPPPLRFFNIGKDTEGNPTYIQVGKITPGAGKIKDNLILFFDLGIDEKAPFRITKMVDNDNTFPDESLVIFNTMNITFSAVLANNSLTIPPGLSDPISVSKYFEKKIPIVMAINQNNELHLVLRNSIRFFPERRTLLILRPPSRPNSLRIRTQRLTEFTGEFESSDSGS